MLTLNMLCGAGAAVVLLYSVVEAMVQLQDKDLLQLQDKDLLQVKEKDLLRLQDRDPPQLQERDMLQLQDRDPPQLQERDVSQLQERIPRDTSDSLRQRTSYLPGQESCGATSKYTHDDQRIVGGEETLPHQYPWFVLLELMFKMHDSCCGGTLIHPRWVLTAAHCLYNPASPTEKDPLAVAYLGIHHQTTCAPPGNNAAAKLPPPNCQKIIVKKMILHDDYSLMRKEHDIALLELAHEAAVGEDVKPVCLATLSMALNDVGVVTGYGMDAWLGGSMQNTLQAVELFIVENSECQSKYSLTITEYMFCAAADHKDACQGDSGGPFMQELSPGRFVQTGIVSFGKGCADKDYPGVYTRVAYYVPWIQRTINYAKICACT